jgi:UMF1 family MFS transporter
VVRHLDRGRRAGHRGAGADQPSHWAWALILFGLGSIGFFAGSSFQDALIVQVADAPETNRVSSLGFALGYLGGGLLFAFNVLLIKYPHWFHLAGRSAMAIRIAFVDVALWWIVFTLPMFRLVHEAAPTARHTGWRELWHTVRGVLRDRPVLNFLLAYWLYIDGIGTLQQMAVDFGSSSAFPPTR